MAEIPIEKKSGMSWIWIALVALVVAALLWWFLAGKRTTASSAGDVLTGDAVATAPAGAYADSAAMNGSGAIGTFVAWADNASARADATKSHEYTADGIHALASAIGALAARDTTGGLQTSTQVNALDEMADRMRRESSSLSHAAIASAAFTSSAALLEQIQQRRFPSAAGDVAAVKESANAIRKDQPLLDQKATIDRFFDRAAAALRTMDGMTG